MSRSTDDNFLKENEKYLDEVAIEVMKILMHRQPPTNTTESAKLADVCYKHAAAMLDAKLGIVRIINKTKFLKTQMIQANLVDKPDNQEVN